jgi:dihydropteroate synthase
VNGSLPPGALLADVAVGGGSPVRVMAALNVSPESFYAGSVVRDEGALRAAAERAEAEGADFIDVGAMSTAPYLDTRIPAEEERRRLAAALEIVAGCVSVPLSADTARAEVAAAALDAGARIINDVTGLRGDPRMLAVAARAEGVVLMASPGGEEDAEPLARVRRLLSESLERAEAAGIPAERIVLDPGIGFFTTAAVSPVRFNCLLIDGLAALAGLRRPLLIGVSRKSFVGRLTGKEDPADRLAGSLAATALAVYNGAAIVRTHDVAATRDAVRVAEAIRGARHHW